MSSILSFPERGPWGDARWRGNASGHVYRELFERLGPRSFCDPMMGSGTSIEVAREMGIEAHGLDLHMGFNALRDSILGAIGGSAAELVVSHPPYGPMIRYSGEVWGSEPHADDLSWCRDDEDFHTKLQMVLLNQREATTGGGHYGTLIGDLRKDGRYVSYQAEAIARMPADELVAVLIKGQHNCVSDRRSYGRMPYPRIAHEFLLLWRKRERKVFQLLRGMAVASNDRLRSTWRAVVHMCLVGLGGQATLSQLYAAVKENATERCEANVNWQAKVRQTLQLSGEWFERCERGVWRLRALLPAHRGHQAA